MGDDGNNSKRIAADFDLTDPIWAEVVRRFQEHQKALGGLPATNTLRIALRQFYGVDKDSPTALDIAPSTHANASQKLI